MCLKVSNEKEKRKFEKSSGKKDKLKTKELFFSICQSLRRKIYDLCLLLIPTLIQTNKYIRGKKKKHSIEVH